MRVDDFHTNTQLIHSNAVTSLPFSHWPLTGACLKILALAASLLCAPLVLAQTPAVEPGAVEPPRPSQTLPSPADPIRVPPPAQRPVEADAGPAFEVASFDISWEEESAIADEHRSSAKLLLRNLLRTKQQRMTLAGLDDAAEALTAHLRDAGYLLAKAIVPPQQVQDRRVGIRVFAGIVGDVLSKSSELYREEKLTRAFEPLRDGPVKRETLEPRLLMLNDLPGLNAVAVFEPGQQSGTTNLVLQPTREQPVVYTARVDNHGIDATGDWRLGLGAAVSNITGNRDALAVNAIRTFSPGELRNARLRYEITSPGFRHTLGLGFSESRYDVEERALRAQQIEGDTEIADLDLYSRWYNSRALSLHSEIGLATGRAELSFSGVSSGVDRLTVLHASLIAEGVDQRFRGIYRATIGLRRGFNDLIGSMDGNGNGNSLTLERGSQSLSGQFRSVNASFNRLQNISAHHNLLLLVAGQYSDDKLASLEKMSLGGPYTVRAYPVGEFTADRALSSSLAWQLDGGVFSDGIAYGEYAWSQVLTLQLFADYGWGKSRNAGVAGGVTRRELSGFGLGARLEFPDQRAFVDLSAAQPFAGKQANNGDDEQYWFRAGIDF